tara:strand:+ start:709 stop:918 length:210 start_codon:yes stop_codon:yes gene_type:complete
MKFKEKKELLAAAKLYAPFNVNEEDVVFYKIDGVYRGVRFGEYGYYVFSAVKMCLKKWKRQKLKNNNGE